MKRPNSNTPSLKQFFRSRSRWVHQTSRIGTNKHGLPVVIRIAGTFRKI